MVKTIIGGVDVQKYTTAYSCKCPPVMGENSFTDCQGNTISGKLGDAVLLDITLEEVPTSVSAALAEALEADRVPVNYTTPVPRRDFFYKTDYSAECDDADPDNPDFEAVDGILWTVKLSLRSVELAAPPGGL